MAIHSERQTQDWLDSMTARLQAGEPPPATSEDPAAVEGLLPLVQSLHEALQPVEPPPAFVAALRAELPTPPRRQLRRFSMAALLTAAGCFAWLCSRYLWGSAAGKGRAKEPVASPL